jgi:hypothetical protein
MRRGLRQEYTQSNARVLFVECACRNLVQCSLDEVPAPSMKNSPHNGRTNPKSRVLLLVPCVLTVLAVLVWLYLFVSPQR